MVATEFLKRIRIKIMDKLNHKKGAVRKKKVA